MAAEPTAGGSIRGLSRVVGDLSSVAGARLATLVLSLGGSVATTHLLAPAQYAVISYMSVGTALLLFAASGWTSAAVARYGRAELERTGGMRSACWARVAITLPIVVIVCVGLVALEAAGALPAEFTWRFAWMTLAIGVLGVACDQMIVALEAFGRMRAGAWAGTARQVLLCGGLVTLVILGSRRSPDAVALLMVAVTLLLTAGLSAALWRHALWPPRLDRPLLRRMLAFSLPMVAFSVSQYGMSSIDLIVLRAFRPAADVGVYALAYSGFATLQSVVASLTVVLVPLFVSLRVGGRSELIASYFERLLPIALLAASVAGGLLAPLGALAVPVVFGSGFKPAGGPFAILVAAAVMLALASLTAPILMLHERTRATAAIGIAALAVNAVGDVVLVGWAGVGGEGPAIATAVAFAVIAGGYLFIARRDIGTAPSLRPSLLAPLLAGILPTLLVSAPAGLACAALVSVLVAVLSPPFGPEDAALVARLDLPQPVQRAITRLAR